MASQSPSQALAKRNSDSDLMPPPPPLKRIKRPPKVLDEDEYTDALSHIIARDFFPGLLETQTQQDYLDALDSENKEWIATAGRRLAEVMTPGPQGRRGVNFSTPRHTAQPMNTPMQWSGDTPLSVASTKVPDTETDSAKAASVEVDTMSLGAFQARYTSEDNESFYKVLDAQNAKRKAKYAWMWHGNKIPTSRQIAYQRQETKRLEGQKRSEGSKELIKTDLDSRPARPDAWKPKAENSLMFTPSSIEDTFETVQQKAEATSRIGPKHVLYHNTRIQSTSNTQEEPPPSPSISAIRDAIAGRPRPTDTEADLAGGETPRVNGYAFVDEDEPEPSKSSTECNEEEYHLKLLSSAGSSTSNPFKLQDTRRREALHHRMVERVAKTKRVEKLASTTKTPVPKFPSSPMVGFGGASPGGPSGLNKASLTPAGQRLWASVGNSTPRQMNPGNNQSGLKNIWTPTARRK
ncbi:hypothetical protein LOZ57_000980 [Ophidiomyces ophidiicola]|uniref:uncharacterized protein n=1 Tax=Ophidiomyces ophidiicola TaxID=1387563 RepID=UPI0020C4013A|nr:uncharacterized protein LOZ57_000980 [Ophidiomyces ophidiicola]KAI1952897.1 hypothetical protein LOZ57_000980 [Ophidiomyces ophidiicola]KAI2061993.1 hypothetical protein LOZ43_000742 [Ophidiomyces ophidiicola]KAI2089907.1 hypothetical protein LOZ36_001585 [Ophidiomyces ophidiicola]